MTIMKLSLSEVQDAHHLIAQYQLIGEFKTAEKLDAWLTHCLDINYEHTATGPLDETEE